MRGLLQEIIEERFIWRLVRDCCISEMFSIGVSVYEKMSNGIFYRLLGSYTYHAFHMDSHMVNILHSGNCYYDSLVNGFRVNVVSEGVDYGCLVSIVAEEVLEYNRKFVQLCKKSKNMKRRRSDMKNLSKRRHHLLQERNQRF